MQAIATGHGGLATLHADSAEAAIHRLESEPMNIPRPLIPTIDVIGVQTRVQVGDKSTTHGQHRRGCRARSYDEGCANQRCLQVESKDGHLCVLRRSYVLENIMKRHGYKHEEVMRAQQQTPRPRVDGA